MVTHVIRVSEAEAASNFASLLDHVREGTEIVIEHDARPMAVVRPVNGDETFDSLAPQQRFKNLQAIRLSAGSQADRVQRSLAALNQPLGIELPAEQWRMAADFREDDDE